MPVFMLVMLYAIVCAYLSQLDCETSNCAHANHVQVRSCDQPVLELREQNVLLNETVVTFDWVRTHSRQASTDYESDALTTAPRCLKVSVTKEQWALNIRCYSLREESMEDIWINIKYVPSVQLNPVPLYLNVYSYKWRIRLSRGQY